MSDNENSKYGKNQTPEDRQRSEERRNLRDDNNEAQRQRSRGVED